MLNVCHERYPDCVRSLCDEDVPLKNFHVFNFWIFGGIRKSFYTENLWTHSSLTFRPSVRPSSGFVRSIHYCFHTHYIYIQRLIHSYYFLGLFSPHTASVFGDVLLAIPPMMRKTASRKSAVQSNKKRAAFIYQFLVNDLTARYR